MSLPKEIIERMDGLIQYNHIDEILTTTKEICENFLEEGFDPEDIKTYLYNKIDNVINYTKELPCYLPYNKSTIKESKWKNKKNIKLEHHINKIL